MGFPRPDGLRGMSGALLERNLRWQFRTVETSEPRTGIVFEDSSPTRGSTLWIATPTVRPLAPVRLTSDEPVDPSTLFSEDFTLVRRSDAGSPRTRIEVPLVARLVQNNEREPYARDAAIIELTPLDRMLEPGTYTLNVAEPLRLRDFGGHPMLVIDPLLGRRQIRVELGASAPPSEIVDHGESFLDSAGRSSAALDGVEGTASWGDGRVEVRWDRAAGDGVDGDVVLATSLARDEVRGCRRTLGEGQGRPSASRLHVLGSAGRRGRPCGSAPDTLHSGPRSGRAGLGHGARGGVHWGLCGG